MLPVAKWLNQCAQPYKLLLLLFLTLYTTILQCEMMNRDNVSSSCSAVIMFSALGIISIIFVSNPWYAAANIAIVDEISDINRSHWRFTKERYIQGLRWDSQE